MYKHSIYNIVLLRNKNEIIINNTLSGAIVSLPPEFLSASNPNELSEDEKATLLSEGIIVHDCIDEYNKVICNEHTLIWEHDHDVAITIAPTMLCNYRCTYCFEKINSTTFPKTTMTKQTADSVIKCIENRIHDLQGGKLHITWFGGEPLLAIGLIRFISAKLIECCKVNSVEYTASMITNGLFLTKETAQMLNEECLISNVQITLDGCLTEYCKSKRATISEYYTVINNIKTIPPNIRLSIRLNYDGYNMDSIKSVIHELQPCLTKSNMSIYLAEIRSYNKHQEKTNKEFFEAERIFYNYIKQNFPIIQYNRINNLIPRGTYCKLIRRKNIVIDSRGNYYRCEHDIGRADRVVGDSVNGFYYNSVDIMYSSIPHDPKCKSCAVFPLCLGGCPHDIFNGLQEHINCDEVVNAIKRQAIKKYYTLTTTPG